MSKRKDAAALPLLHTESVKGEKQWEDERKEKGAKEVEMVLVFQSPFASCFLPLSPCQTFFFKELLGDSVSGDEECVLL